MEPDKNPPVSPYQRKKAEMELLRQLPETTDAFLLNTFLLELGPQQRVWVKTSPDEYQSFVNGKKRLIFPVQNLPPCREVTAQEYLLIREERLKERKKAERERMEMKMKMEMEKLLDVKDELAGNSNGNTTCAGDLRMLKEHLSGGNLNLPPTCCVSYPYGGDNLRNFEVIICPDEGYFLGGTFVFTFQIPPSYPHEPPKVRCKTEVNHPNISSEGNVSLDILSGDWKPVLDVKSIICGLCDLFTRPHPEDPLDRSS